LIAGRRFYSRSLKEGEWEFAELSALPKDFTKIPEDSGIGNVKASVPGKP
jgi:hypothetical protein